jgi:7-keto-8-aminopelargonate synthetase-like enzyme
VSDGVFSLDGTIANLKAIRRARPSVTGRWS